MVLPRGVLCTPSLTAPTSGGWYTLDFRILANADPTGKVVDAQQIIRDYQIFIDSRR